MEKQIICADCGAQYSYNETPGYPRKYCEVCSAKRKQSFNQPNIANKAVAQAVQTNANKPKEDGKFTTMYVSYVKDLVVSGIELDKAITIINTAKQAFS